MGKAECCIKMLNILSSGRVYSREALAELLETNVRNVSAYRVELRMLGYEIVTVPGKLGGMRLAESCRFPALKLTSPERKAMQEAMDFVLAQDEFIHRDAFTSAMGKIYSSNQIPQGPGILVIDSTHPSIDSKQMEKRYDFVEECISVGRVFHANYPTSSSPRLTFHPYKLFLYDEQWRFFAYCPSRGEIEDFPLACIYGYTQGTESIAPWRGFNPEYYFDRFGLRKEEEAEKVEFYVSEKALPAFAGREFGADQRLLVDENGKNRCSLYLQGKERILSFVLSQGAEIEVVSPAWVREEMLRLCEGIRKKYAKPPTD
ncbi:MAG: WYL domain-containing protein [Bacilli bacterium]|nr:WYL domain-containing protein [Bacilli bacterium]